MFNVYSEEGNHREVFLLVREGAEKALKRITDREGNWPKLMEWGWLENRHLIRILDAFAFELWSIDRIEYALDIYRKLLKSNLNDNIGARYNILAINLDYRPDTLEKEFGVSESGFLDGIKLNDWFEKNAKKFPEEFD